MRLQDHVAAHALMTPAPSNNFHPLKKWAAYAAHNIYALAIQPSLIGELAVLLQFVLPDSCR